MGYPIQCWNRWLVKKRRLSFVKEPVQEPFNWQSTPRVMWWQSMSRTITITLIAVLLVSSLTVIHFASAASNPSVPQVTVKLVDRSYDVATSYSTNPLTGETITTPAHRVENRTIDVVIKNQPFTRTEDSGNITGLFYNIEAKSHFESWPITGSDFRGRYTVEPSTSEETVVTFPLNSDCWYLLTGNQVDVRVQAVTGTKYLVWSQSGIQPMGTGFSLDSASGWSSTQTIDLSNSQVSNSQSVTPSPTPLQATLNDSCRVEPTQNSTEAPIQPNTQTDVQSGFTWKDIALAVACTAIAVLVVVLLLSRRRRA